MSNLPFIFPLAGGCLAVFGALFWICVLVISGRHADREASYQFQTKIKN